MVDKGLISAADQEQQPDNQVIEDTNVTNDSHQTAPVAEDEESQTAETLNESVTAPSNEKLDARDESEVENDTCCQKSDSKVEQEPILVDENIEQKETVDEKADENIEQKDAVDEKADENIEQEEAADEKADENIEQEEAVDEKADENIEQEEAVDEKVDENIEQEEAVDDEVDEDDEESTTEQEVENVAKPQKMTREQQTDKKVNEYAVKNRSELIVLLGAALQERPVQQLRSTVEAVKINFYKSLRAENEKARTQFVEAGNIAEDFVAPTDEFEIKLKSLIEDYRKKRDHYIANLEQEKELNYKAKLAVIEEIKELSNSSETLHNTFTAFRDLQNRWKEIGLVPQSRLKDLWDTYHHHVENFYNYVKINKELRDLDLKRNHEAKLLLCEEAETLMIDPSPIASFQKLQKLHDQWREIGPVDRELKEQLWDRFRKASTEINKRHQSHFDELREEHLQNLKLKEEICAKVEEYAEKLYTSRNEWSEASKDIIELQKMWRTIGFVPRKDNAQIYDRFRSACDKFFETKRLYFSELKDEMEDNLQIKIDLCVQAEALADSDDWQATTDALIELQKLWKESGAVSRRHSNTVWKRFRSACDKFFNRKAEHYKGLDSKYIGNLELKQSMLQEFAQAAEDNASLTFDKLKEFQRRWGEIGFVPIKQKDPIAKQYKEVMDKLFAMIRGGEGERRIEHFKNRVGAMRSRGGEGRVNNERDRLYDKVRKIESDIQIWENNIGFFANSKNAETLVKGVEQKIEKAKEEIKSIIEKINVIDND